MCRPLRILIVEQTRTVGRKNYYPYFTHIEPRKIKITVCGRSPDLQEPVNESFSCSAKENIIPFWWNQRGGCSLHQLELTLPAVTVTVPVLVIVTVLFIYGSTLFQTPTAALKFFWGMQLCIWSLATSTLHGQFSFCGLWLQHNCKSHKPPDQV